MLPKLKTKILVFGTFDVVHKGHLDFFKQARGLSDNPYLIVSVARDVNVKRIKGRSPLYNERLRARALRKAKGVDKVVLGGVRGHLPHILSVKPHIIALGYDQVAYTRNLKADLGKKGLKIKVYRLKSYKPSIYKSSKVKAKKV